LLCYWPPVKINYKDLIILVFYRSYSYGYGIIVNACHGTWQSWYNVNFKFHGTVFV
jgi:hypothetical protein